MSANNRGGRPGIPALGVPLGRTVTAGAGLTGGGALSGNITLAVGAGTGITVNADDVAVNQATAFAWTAAHTLTVNAIATAATLGQTWQNTTAATAGVPVQYSPATKKTGHAWKSGAPPASQQWDWIEQVRPATGGEVTTSALHWLSAMDGGGYTSRMNLSNFGYLFLGGACEAMNYLRANAAQTYALYAPIGGAQVKASFGYDSIDAAALIIGATTATGVRIGKSGGNVGLYAATPVPRAAHIVDADGTLADITTKFNTLLVAVENIGILLTA